MKYNLTKMMHGQIGETRKTSKISISLF